MRQLNAASHAQIISYGDDLENAKRALEHGDVYAVLYIPLKFGKMYFQVIVQMLFSYTTHYSMLQVVTHLRISQD